MAEKLIIASGKGGVGKSTIAAFLGRAICERGKSVLLIDTDVALSALDILLDIGEKIVYNWYDVICGRCSAEDAIIKVNENMSLLPSPLSAVNDIRPEEIKALIDNYNDGFDYILIDAPAGIGNGLLRLTAAADKALVVATPDEVSVRGAFTVAGVLEDNGVSQSRLIINRFRKKASKQGKMLDFDSVIDKTGVRLIGIVPEDSRLVFTSVTHENINKKSNSAKAFARIAARVEGEEVLLGKL